jgi:chemotaxis regulatin CheY-phosphate phosphatase CheZ
MEIDMTSAAAERDTDGHIRFGALAPPLAAQLRGLKIDADRLDNLQKDADAVIRLYVQGLLTEQQAERALRKLSRRINDLAAEAR